jgi:Spx/MgsR family transcriptional regulator
MKTTVFGIKTCDSCRRALNFLAEMDARPEWHDFRADGLSPELLDRLLQRLSWEKLLNRSSLAWRGLAEEDKRGLTADKARRLMLENPLLIKRPVVAMGSHYSCGFDAATRDALAALAEKEAV